MSKLWHLVWKAVRVLTKQEHRKTDFASNTYGSTAGTVATAALLSRKLEQLGHEFADFAKLDRDLPVRKKRSVALLLAFRPWVFSVFDGLQQAKKGS
ncbi:MAG: hypothetical protein AB7T07_11900 [Steroidobacteraceae bacterium]